MKTWWGKLYAAREHPEPGKPSTYFKNKIIKANGELESYRKKLLQFLDPKKSHGEQFEYGVNNIKGFAHATISEILSDLFPQDCIRWNQKVQQAIQILKADEPFNKQLLKGKYIKTKEAYDDLKKRLETIKVHLPGITDYIQLDLFFWYVATRNYWRIQPGGTPDIEFWDVFQNEKIIAMDYSIPEDLTGYDKDQIVEIVRKIRKAKNESRGKAASQLNDFVNQGKTSSNDNMQIGDYVIINNGQSEILGSCVIRGDYKYDKTKPCPHTRKVEYLSKETKKIPKQNWGITTSKKLGGWKEFDDIISGVSTTTRIGTTKKSGTGTLSSQARKYLEKLTKNHNLLLYGPPGTSKTFVMQQIFNHIERTPFIHEFDTPVEAVWLTFHQGFSYEDFILGLRPKPTKAGFELKARAGILLELAIKIKENGGSAVLFIDEINRANVSSVFGEFMTVMEPEKRLDTKGNETDETVPIRLAMINNGDEVELSDRTTRKIENPFKFPANIFVISTMNSLDRSVAPLDSALKRRFYIENLPPDYQLLKEKLGLYDIYFSNPKTPQETAIMLLRRINNFVEATLGDDFCFGHTYVWDVVKCETDDARWNALAEAWSNSIYPHLKELFRSQPDTLKSIIKFEVTNQPDGYPFKSRPVDNAIGELDNTDELIDETLLDKLSTEKKSAFLKFIATRTQSSKTTSE